MKVQIYGDNGYVTSELYNIVGGIDTVELIDILYEKKLLSAEDVNRLLPPDYEVCEPPTK